MAEFRPRMKLPFPGVARGQSFGCAPKFSLSTPDGQRIYAFALAERAQPQVFEYLDDAEGIRSLTNLVRSEEVLAVIHGERLNVEVASVVDVQIGGETHKDRLLLKGT